ncbi:hypothetical protein KAU33_08955 [Candidatus Dependentiae bacterium]|nr:hypothetical protein [Candidatus Dependentiae bacterium]
MEGDLRVWWIPQIPSKEPFHVSVESEEEAERIMDILGEYDSYQFMHNIKPDYSNAGGIEIEMADGSWEGYED